MDKVFRLLFTLILSVGLLSSCSMVESGREKENNIAFDSLKVERTVHLMDKKENPACQIVLDFKYPSELTPKETLQKLQQFYLLSFFGEKYEQMDPQEAIAFYAEDYVADYKSLEADYTKDLKHATKEMPMGDWYSYYEHGENSLVFNAQDIVSFQVSFENYTGGAHPTHAYSNHTFCLNLGKGLDEEDLFVEDFQADLSKIIVDALVRQNELKKPIELEDIGFFSAEEIVPNENFLVKKDGLLYTYNEYEIAAYALGSIDVFLPYGEIRHLFREDNPIAALYL